MCTAATYKTKDFYFGRTLDYEISYGDRITVTPRGYAFDLRCGGRIENHYAMIGMACVMNGYPLYYDAVNEKGLCIAGLNFVGNAYYNKPAAGKENIAQFELIPLILGKCATLDEARRLLESINITDTPFSDDLPVAQLHWIIADNGGCITLEAVKDGLKVYDNPVGVLTNNPPFETQMFNLNNYMHLSAENRENTFAKGLSLDRAAFVKMNSVSGDSEEESVSQFFHILASVDQQRGCCKVEDGKYEVTLYTSCCSAQKGIYYYTTYGNHRISAVDMRKENLDGESLIVYTPVSGEQIYMQN